MNQKKIIIVSVIAFVIILASGLAFIFTRNNTTSNSTAKTSTESQVYTLKPEDIGLSLTRITYTKKAPAGPGVNLSITKLEGITKIESRITYSFVNDAGDNLNDGLESEISITPGQPVSQDYPFGTCSDVCHYVKSISNVKAILKVTKTDGKVYVVNASVE